MLVATNIPRYLLVPSRIQRPVIGPPEALFSLSNGCFSVSWRLQQLEFLQPERLDR